MSWRTRSIPDQSGRTAVVTGPAAASATLIAREPARRGARVVLACRGRRRGAVALDRLLTQVPKARAELRLLDPAVPASVREFADALPCARLDLLVDNASVAAVPYARTRTASRCTPA